MRPIHQNSLKVRCVNAGTIHNTAMSKCGDGMEDRDDPRRHHKNARDEP
jgi:hypothetical protein